MSIQFSSNNGTTITPDVFKLNRVMTSETLDKNQYDYIDNSGLSIQKISKQHLFICDPNFPICEYILFDRWQIIYDAAYTGFGNVMFVARLDDASDITKRKNINQVLALYNYAGNLPVPSFEYVFMKVVKLNSNENIINYITGTLFCLYQPFIRLSHASLGTYFVPQRTVHRVRYNNIVETSIDSNDTSQNQIITAITAAGADEGKILIAPGRYLLEASYGVSLPDSLLTGTQPIEIQLSINSIIRKKNFGVVQSIGSLITGNVSLSCIFKIEDYQATSNNRAVLEIMAYLWWNSSGMNLRNDEFTTMSLTYLG